MKTKFVRNGKTQRREMLVASQRGETLDTKRADRLVEGPSPWLISFAYERQRAGTGVLLHYDVEGLWSLRTYLSKRPCDLGELMGLLEAALGVLDLCAEQRLGTEGLLFDPEFVFVDAQCRPHFVLLPLDHVPFQERNSPLALLAAASESAHLRFASPDAEGLARRLHQLVVDLDGVFSINNFRRFVEDERRQGELGAPEARRSVVEPGASSVWASAGSSSGRTADSGALFWSPLAGFAEQTPAQPEPASAPAPAPEPAAPRWSEPLPDAAMHVQSVPPAPVGEVPAAVPVSPAPAGGVPAGAPVADHAGRAGYDNMVAAQATPMPGPGETPRPSSAQPTAVLPAAPPAAPSPTPPQPAVAAPAAASLVRPSTGERYPLPVGTELVAGRGTGSAIHLRGNPKISRSHVALTWTGRVLVVRDLGAVNGVWVNGQRLESQRPAYIVPGESFRLANEELELAAGRDGR